jgi:hypothetical protein
VARKSVKFSSKTGSSLISGGSISAPLSVYFPPVTLLFCPKYFKISLNINFLIRESQYYICCDVLYGTLYLISGKIFEESRFKIFSSHMTKIQNLNTVNSRLLESQIHKDSVRMYLIV